MLTCSIDDLIHRDRVVGIATGYGMDDRVNRFRVPGGSRIFSTSSRAALGSTQRPIRWVPGVERPRREADHLMPRSRKFWTIDPLPHTSS
jgi:hypothetical protein